MTVFDEATAVRRLATAATRSGPTSGSPSSPGRRRRGERRGADGQRAARGARLLAAPVPGRDQRALPPGAPPEPAQVEVSWLKQGKMAATARATLIQDGRPVLETTVTTGALGDPADVGGLSWTGEPPRLPPIEECIGSQDAPGRPGLQRLRRAGRPAAGPGHRRAGCAASPPGRRRCAATSSCARTAATRTPTCSRWPWTRCRRWCSASRVVGWSPTVELTWHMRAVPAPGAAAGGGPLPARQRRLVRRGGRGLGQRGPPGRAEPPDRPGRPGAARPAGLAWRAAHRRRRSPLPGHGA